MAKSSKKQIYEDELKVIAELQKNAKENVLSWLSVFLIRVFLFSFSYVPFFPSLLKA
ncbi:unnamed protein product, partial [marine sediment metagenome]